jgi:hypothetical protein
MAYIWSDNGTPLPNIVGAAYNNSYADPLTPGQQPQAQVQQSYPQQSMQSPQQDMPQMPQQQQYQPQQYQQPQQQQYQSPFQQQPYQQHQYQMPYQLAQQQQTQFQSNGMFPNAAAGGRFNLNSGYNSASQYSNNSLLPWQNKYSLRQQNNLAPLTNNALNFSY